APETVPTGPTWSIQLVGGADVSSANRLAVKPLQQLKTLNTGDVTLSVVPDNASSRSGQVVRVRTGTGDIEVAAGRDFKFVNLSPNQDPANLQYSRDLINASRAAIYTTGQAVGGDNRFLTHGGDVRIFAQGDAKGFDFDNVSTTGFPSTGADSVYAA